jgi:hypothetical protein
LQWPNLHFLQDAESPARVVQEENQSQQTVTGFKWTPILVQDQGLQLQPLCGTSTSLGLLVLGFSVLSLMEPLHQALLVIPQIIISVCSISIETCNKLSEIMTPFYGGNKTHPRINMTTGNSTFNWLFDTGGVITLMNANSFWQAFKSKWPKLFKKETGCVAAKGSRMNSIEVFEVPMTIWVRMFVHPVTVVEDIKDNIIGIDFMHTNRMNFDAASKQITFAHMLTNALYAVKETTIPAY